MMSFSIDDVRRVGGDLAAVLGRMDPADVPRFDGVSVPEGTWTPPPEAPALGHLVIAGFIARRVELAGGVCIELFGPGELVRTGEVEGTDSFDMVPVEVSWTVLSPVALAVLDADFAANATHDPGLQTALLAQDTRRSDALALRLALVQLPRVSSRVHFLLWQLADRFGSPGRSGVLLALHLSHGLLAEMVSGDPNEVRTAMRDLAEQGVIAQAPRGLWLNGAPPNSLGSDTSAALSGVL